MTLRITFHPKVFSEVDVIQTHYEKISGPLLADDFYEELVRCMFKAAQQPNIYALQTRSLRRVNLKRFPYNFLFRVLEDRIRVTVVRHHARKSSYGVKRI